MKKNIFIALAILSAITTGCKKSDDKNNTLQPLITSGTWSITYYFDTDHEETTSYSSHQFSFSANGSVSVNSNSGNHSGSWSEANDDSQSKMILSFSTGTSLDELSDDWHVISKSENKIELQDVSGGNGGTDFLTFEKK